MVLGSDKPEPLTIGRRSPKHGLFAEEILGLKDWECYWGSKKIRYKGIVRQVRRRVTHSIVRREAWHIELSPVTHLVLRELPSKIGTVLELSVQSLEKVIYFASYVVTDVNEEAPLDCRAGAPGIQSKKMIEGEHVRDLERLAQSLWGKKEDQERRSTGFDSRPWLEG